MNRAKRVPFSVVIATLILFCSAEQSTAQTFTNPPGASDAVVPPADPSSEDQGSSRVGAGFRMSSLGFGGEVAAEVTHSTNIRGGFNFFSYSRGYDNNGIHYAGDLRWFSAEAHYDWFPFAHGLHLSPGVIAFNDNHVNASASVAGGNTFSLNGVQYYSDPTNPVSGSAKLSFNKIAPTIMFGLGNLVPRNGKHFSVNIEGGVAFQGSPKIGLNLAGSACIPSPHGPTCLNVATDPTIQGNIQGEQTKISNDLSPFKYYPLVSLTIGYRF